MSEEPCYIVPTFYSTQPFRDFLKEYLEIDEFVRFLLLCKGFYGAYERDSSALETTPPRKVMSQLFWSGFILRPSISFDELQYCIQKSHQRRKDSTMLDNLNYHYCVQFPYPTRRAALYFYFNGFQSLTIKYVYNVNDSVGTDDDFRVNVEDDFDNELMRNLWLWLCKKNLVSDNGRLHCRLLSSANPGEFRRDIHDDVLDYRFSFETDAHQKYLQSKIELDGKPRRIEYYYKQLAKNALLICNEECER